MNVRKYTNRLLNLIDEGAIDKDTVINACLKYMSESDVEDMMRAKEILTDEDE